MQSAAASRDALQPKVSVASIKPAKLSPPDRIDSRTTVKFSGMQPVEEKPLIGEASRTQQAADSEISPTTPGLDDTPYIRFAIEQLTRDEETLGRRRQGAASDESYSVDRIIPDEGLGYYGHSQRSTRHEREAPDPTTRHSEPARKWRRTQCVVLLISNGKTQLPMMSSCQFRIQTIHIVFQDSSSCQECSDSSRLQPSLCVAFS